MKKILILLQLDEEQKRSILEAAPDADLTFSSPREVSAEQIADADAILGQAPAALLPNARNLRWLQITNAGTEPYSLPGVLPSGAVLTNASGTFGPAISEHMVACVFMLFKKLHLYRDNMASAQWLDRGNVRRVEGAQVLVVGAGDIGTSFARRMKALGCRTIGIKRTPAPCCPPEFDALYCMDALDALLPEADIVAMALPGTPATKGILHRGRIDSMKRDAVLVNVGRGNAVDCLALSDALRENRLWGAALDVTDPEPLPPEHPLWRCENALITPHVSGFTHLPDTYVFTLELCRQNLRRFLEDAPLLNVVDLSTGYRAGGAEVLNFDRKDLRA